MPERRCKVCGRLFSYSSWAYAKNADRGFTDPEYCNDHQQEHREGKQTLAVPYAGVRPLPGADLSQVLVGSLGRLEHPSREIVFTTTEHNFDPTEYGFRDEHAHQILEWLSHPDQQVAVLVGPTGSGKSTAMPYLLMDLLSQYASLDRGGQIAICQPRQVAAAGNADRLGHLLGSEIGMGQEVGLVHGDVRDMADWRNRVIAYTDGSLANILKWGESLDKYGLIVIDEAHERNMRIDVILRLLRDYLPLYPKLRVIIASATINAEGFLTYFGSQTAKIFEADGRAIGYGEPHFADSSEALPIDQPGKARKQLREGKAADKTRWLIDQIVSGNRRVGDILVFVPGMPEIKATLDVLARAFPESKIGKLRIEFNTLHSETSEVEKKRMRRENKNSRLVRVFMATDIAQTSVTIDGLVYVISSGIKNVKRWDPTTNVSSIGPEMISKADAKQQFGRVGRNQEGEVFCLFTQQQYDALPDHSDPEITRSSPIDAVLDLVSTGVPVAQVGLGWLSDPGSDPVSDSVEALKAAAILTPEGHLTQWGEIQQSLGLAPKVTELLMLADRLGCGYEVATLIPVLRNGGKRSFLVKNTNWDSYTWQQVRRIHKALQAGALDDIEFVLKVMYLWDNPPGSDQLSNGDKAAARQAWSKAHFLRATVLREIAAEREVIKEKIYARSSEKNRVIDLAACDKVRLAFVLTFPELARASYSYLDPSRYEYHSNPEIEEETLLTARVWADTKWRSLVLSNSTDSAALFDEAIALVEKSQEEARNLNQRARLLIDQVFPVGSVFRGEADVLDDGECVVDSGDIVELPDLIDIRLRNSDEDEELDENGEDEEDEGNGVFDGVLTLEEGFCFQLSQGVYGGFEAEVVGYDFENLSEIVVVLEPFGEDQFGNFAQANSAGSFIEVEVEGYETYPDDRRQALVVREPDTGLMILMDPEDLGFGSSPAIVSQLPIGSRFEVFVWEVDSKKRRARLSLLPIIEEWTRYQIEGSGDGKKSFEVGAVVIDSRGPFKDDGNGENVTLLLDWSNPSEGALYVVTVPKRFLFKPALEFLVGERVTITLFAESRRTLSVGLNSLPDRVEFFIESQAGLGWKDRKLTWRGRMSFDQFLELAGLSDYQPYLRALERLYRLSNQLSIDSVVDGSWQQVAVIRFPLGSMRYNLEVRRVGDPGSWVDLGEGYEGFIPRSSLPMNLRAIQVGSIIKAAKVTDHNGGKRNIVLDARVADNDPLSKFKTGQVVTGTVVDYKRNDRGAYAVMVELEPGVRGFLHIREVSGFVPNLEAEFPLNRKVMVRITEIDRRKRQIAVSRKNVY